ncbi:hypothetical protein JZO78_04990 [Enterococcus ureilyticus]|uniref:hypothetical protein n=1 Tax=Enterococcus ureilyticus TaxID=1131292 RepID=UPI001A922CDF|nr:hypothetical protein [Enterococcus ureilyticus]MBO0445690.1 hypothetical protein [Enterococcus ureilyticus]
MSIDMYLGQARSQASSVKSACSQLAQGYTSLMQSNQQFMSAGELSSKGYESAKEFFAAVIQPLVQGAEVGADMTAEACQKFVDQYTSEVDSIDLKSDDLERRIRQINTSILNMESINRGLPKLPTGTNPLEQANRRIIESLETTKRDLEQKLEKLMTFNGTSPAIFDGVNSFYSTLSQGLQQANGGFNPATGTFSVPKGKALEWTKTVQTAYQKANQKKLDNLMKLPYSIENAIKVYEIAQKDPSMRLDEKAVKWFRDHKDDLQGLFVDFSMSTIEETLKHNGDDLALSLGFMFGSIYKNPPYGSWMSAANQGLTAGITSTASSAFNATTDFLGSTIKATSLGIGIGTVLGLASGDSFGQAFSSSVVTTGVSYVVTAFVVGNPVGLAAVGTAMAISVGVTIAYNYNLLGMKDLAEGMGNAIDDGISWTGDKLNDGATWVKDKVNDIGTGVKQIGSVVEDAWDSLTNWSW